MATTNTSSLAREQMQSDFEAFKAAHPAFEATQDLDALRATDYHRLDQLGQVYLDYTGGGLYAESQLVKHMHLLSTHVFGNPHSTNPTSLAMTHLVEQARRYVLEYFNADPNEYWVIFTQNASGALKILGESYPFSEGANYLLTYDNHNSVNGIREFAHARGAKVTYVPLVPPDLRVNTEKLYAGLDSANPKAQNLFAFPAQSNFSGVQHPLQWIAEAQARGWDVLLDAAAFAPTNRLDLSIWKPDFVDLSFYKIFGYPTGIGALIGRKDKMRKLRRPWYAGGTIVFSTVQSQGHYLKPGPSGFEDGTVNYLGLPAIEIGLRHIKEVGIDKIHARVSTLAHWLLQGLLLLRHGNGRPLIRMYGPTDMTGRGATLEMNFYDPNEQLIDCEIVEALANLQNISLRAGCHCNPGAREISFGFTEADLADCFRDKERMTYEQFLQVIDGKTTGAVRASLGLVTNFEDVYRCLAFARSFIDQHVANYRLIKPPSDSLSTPLS